MALQIPSRKVPGPDSFPTQPEAVRDWLTTLHPLTATDNCRALQRGLKHSNRLATDNHKRVEIAAIFEPAVDEAVTELQQQFVDLSLPLPARARALRQLVIELLREQTCTYKIIVNDTYASLLPGQTGIRLPALYKALRSLGQLIGCHLLTLSEPCPSLLRDANKLYDLAEQSGLVHATLERDELELATSGDQTAWSISDAYVFVQLLSLCRPYNQRQQQIPVLLSFIARHTSALRVEAYAPDTRYNEMTYGVQLEQDGPAQHLKHITRSSTPTLRTLDVAPLLTIIDDASARIPAAVNAFYESETLSRTTLLHLRESLHRQNQRRFARAITRKTVQCEIGRRQITAAVLFSAEADAETGRAVLSPAQDYWPQPPVHHRGRWVVCNENRFGACLEWLDNEPTDASVGEVIALKRHSKDKKISWVTGIIRWMKSQSTSHLQIGIEFLGSDASVLRAERGRDELLTTHDCLLTPLLPGAFQSQCTQALLTPPLIFREGEDIIAGTQPVHLVERLLATASLDVFAVQTAETG